jgi:uncharacterized protein
MNGVLLYMKMNNMENIYEVKLLKEQVKDVDSKKGIITGYLSAFDNVDGDNEIVTKGAFLRSIQDRGPDSKQPRIKWLLNHQPSQTIGKFLSLKEDDHGLMYVGQVGTHDLGQDFLKMAESGCCTEHSIGFNVITSEKSKTGPRYLKELRLHEGSSLSAWGSNPNTPIVSIKSIPERIEQFAKSYQDGQYDEDGIELELLQIKQLIISRVNQPATAAESQKPATAVDDKDIRESLAMLNSHIKGHKALVMPEVLKVSQWELDRQRFELGKAGRRMR